MAKVRYDTGTNRITEFEEEKGKKYEEENTNAQTKRRVSEMGSGRKTRTIQDEHLKLKGNQRRYQSEGKKYLEHCSTKKKKERKGFNIKRQPSSHSGAENTQSRGVSKREIKGVELDAQSHFHTCRRDAKKVTSVPCKGLMNTRKNEFLVPMTRGHQGQKKKDSEW
ncbi:hypothetical protein NPIL_225541 [Nephila pilipes]|uniref:Uncharacterized protein n=1 Tax=Nephila pilipes TaxID=299642 RepID=A0A8X6UHG9_NEPPI|nr:hypothetical protein NPIL_225541 [Nephila pilipes]